MDSATAAGDDFYAFANGAWAKNTAIPADKSNYGMFTALDELSKKRTREILDEAKNDSGSKIGRAYASFLDEAGVEAKGLAPIAPWLDEIRGSEIESRTIGSDRRRLTAWVLADPLVVMSTRMTKTPTSISTDRTIRSWHAGP